MPPNSLGAFNAGVRQLTNIHCFGYSYAPVPGRRTPIWAAQQARRWDEGAAAYSLSVVVSELDDYATSD
jgi:hypothetical protein